MPVKKNFEDVKSYIEAEGYKVLSDTYINNKQKLKLECPQGHECYINYNSFSVKNVRCTICRLDATRLKVQDVRDYVENEGYEWVSGIYQNSSSLLTLKCPNGHEEYTVTFNNFKSAEKRCRSCHFERQKLEYQFVKEVFEKEGYQLISTEYLGTKEDLEVCCPKGHAYQTTFNNFYNNKARCLQCYRDNNIGEGHPSWKGVTPENKRQRRLKPYRDWRDTVFQRDNYECQACGKHSRNLQAHHIENFAEHEDKRLDIDNGITLCFECHSQTVKGSFHQIYGVKNNNRDQLEEYIAMKQEN